MKLKDKVAVVTGGGSGIGAAVVRTFASEGATVVVGDFNDEAAKSVAASVTESGGRALAVRMDVSDYQNVLEVVNHSVQQYDSVDILVNAAGIFKTGTVLETPVEAWNQVIQVNLTGTFNCSKAVLPHMISAGGGSIVNFSSSTGAYLATTNATAYVTSKGGVALLTKAMAGDYGSQNIRVNAVCPGPTNTPMLRNDVPEEQLKSISSRIPLGRLGEPEEVARAVLFLASEDSSFINGAVISVDGGQTAII